VEPLGEPESILLSPTLDSVRTARCFALSAAGDLVEDDRRQTLELLVSEIVTNAIIHARTGCIVVLCRLGPRVRVEVEDGSRQVPYMKADADQRGGWGIRLLAMLAHDWGVDRRPGGKSVWFVV
jgi:anti-sigma regulatory factor (Ser/Thr protein kinase)